MTKYGYIRVSTDAQVDGTSLDAQEQTLLASGVKPENIFRDAGVSGSIALFERPAGAKMQQLLCDGDVIVVTKIDRAFRSMTDFMRTTEKLHAEGVGLIVLNMSAEPLLSSPVSTLILRIMASVADFERATISERTKEGKAMRVAKGLYPGGKPPFGHDIIGDGQVVAKPWYPKALALVREMSAQKRTLAQIRDALKEKFNVTPANGTIMRLAKISRATGAEDLL